MACEKVFLLTAMAMVWCGCSSVSRVEYGVGTRATDELQRLDRDLHSGLEAQYDALDADDFSAARAEWLQAKNLSDHGADRETVLKALGSSRTLLNQATDRAQQLAKGVQDILTARAAAVAAGAKTFPGGIADLNRKDIEFRDQLAKLEQGKLGANARSALTRQYLDLELRGIEREKLAEVKDMIDDARKNGADQNAPRALAQAEKDLQTAKYVLDIDRHNEDLTATAVAVAKASAMVADQRMVGQNQK